MPFDPTVESIFTRESVWLPTLPSVCVWITRCRPYGDPAFKDADRKSTKAGSIEMNALRALLGCRPTTLAGAIALLDHLGQPCTLRDTDGGEDTVLCSTNNWWPENKDEVRAFPHVLAGALRILIGNTQAPSEP
jgi:hypothetical protein